MKKLLIIYILITSTCYGQSILKCLGKEEAHYARIKYTGPNYKLNQMMLEKVSSLSGIQMLNEAFTSICKDKDTYPSLKLLENLIINDKKIFSIGKSRNRILYYQTIRDIKMKAGQILIEYLSHLQALSPTPHCIEDKIPGVKELYARYRYLADVLPVKKLNGELKELRMIFSKLRQVDKIIKSCKK